MVPYLPPRDEGDILSCLVGPECGEGAGTRFPQIRGKFRFVEKGTDGTSLVKLPLIFDETSPRELWK